MPNFAFGLLVHQKILKIFPLFGPFLGVGPFMTPGTLLHKLESPCPKVASYYINAFWPLVCERNIFQILKISPIVASFWAPMGPAP